MSIVCLFGRCRALCSHRLHWWTFSLALTLVAISIFSLFSISFLYVLVAVGRRRRHRHLFCHFRKRDYFFFRWNVRHVCYGHMYYTAPVYWTRDLWARSSHTRMHIVDVVSFCGSLENIKMKENRTNFPSHASPQHHLFLEYNFACKLKQNASDNHSMAV